MLRVENMWWGLKMCGERLWVVETSGWEVKRKAGGSKTCAGGQKCMVGVENVYWGSKMHAGRSNTRLGVE
jgi:hypothetical protein